MAGMLAKVSLFADCGHCGLPASGKVSQPKGAQQLRQVAETMLLRPAQRKPMLVGVGRSQLSRRRRRRLRRELFKVNVQTYSSVE